MGSRETGQRGEEAARRFLERAGYTIAACNYHTRYGELDIVAERDGICAFVEVKTRKSTAYGLPCEAVDIRKQEKIVQAAYGYMAEHSITGMVRFDVIEVLAPEGVPTAIRHLENAFYPPEG